MNNQTYGCRVAKGENFYSGPKMGPKLVARHRNSSDKGKLINSTFDEADISDEILSEGMFSNRWVKVSLCSDNMTNSSLAQKRNSNINFLDLWSLNSKDINCSDKDIFEITPWDRKENTIDVSKFSRTTAKSQSMKYNTTLPKSSSAKIGGKTMKDDISTLLKCMVRQKKEERSKSTCRHTIVEKLNDISHRSASKNEDQNSGLFISMKDIWPSENSNRKF